ARHEQLEKAEAVHVEAVNHHNPDHQHGKRGGEADVAGDGGEIGEQAKEVGRQHEHEERENEGEAAHALRGGGIIQQRGGELVEQLRAGLPARWNQSAAGSGEIEIGPGQHDDHDHEQRRIGERQIILADIEREDLVDMELVDRIDLV